MEYANIELKTQEFFYSNGHVVLSSDKEKELEKLFSVCEKNLTYGEEVVFYTKKIEAENFYTAKREEVYWGYHVRCFACGEEVSCYQVVELPYKQVKYFLSRFQTEGMRVSLVRREW